MQFSQSRNWICFSHVLFFRPCRRATWRSWSTWGWLCVATSLEPLYTREPWCHHDSFCQLQQEQGKPPQHHSLAARMEMYISSSVCCIQTVSVAMEQILKVVAAKQQQRQGFIVAEQMSWNDDVTIAGVEDYFHRRWFWKSWAEHVLSVLERCGTADCR